MEWDCDDDDDYDDDDGDYDDEDYYDDEYENDFDFDNGDTAMAELYDQYKKSHQTFDMYNNLNDEEFIALVNSLNLPVPSHWYDSDEYDEVAVTNSKTRSQKRKTPRHQRGKNNSKNNGATNKNTEIMSDALLRSNMDSPSEDLLKNCESRGIVTKTSAGSSSKGQKSTQSNQRGKNNSNCNGATNKNIEIMSDALLRSNMDSPSQDLLKNCESRGIVTKTSAGSSSKGQKSTPANPIEENLDPSSAKVFERLATREYKSLQSNNTVSSGVVLVDSNALVDRHSSSKARTMSNY